TELKSWPKSSTQMIGCTIEMMTKTGIRIVARTRRRNRYQVSRRNSMRSAAGRSRRSLLVIGVAGGGEIDVIERRPSERDLGDAEARLLQRRQQGRHRAGSAGNVGVEARAVHHHP